MSGWFRALAAAAPFFALFFCARPAACDKVHLKNGRTISCDHAEIQGEKVVFFKYGGRVALSLSSVERLEHEEPPPPVTPPPEAENEERAAAGSPDRPGSRNKAAPRFLDAAAGRATESKEERSFAPAPSDFENRDGSAAAGADETVNTPEDWRKRTTKTFRPPAGPSSDSFEPAGTNAPPTTDLPPKDQSKKTDEPPLSPDDMDLEGRIADLQARLDRLERKRRAARFAGEPYEKLDREISELRRELMSVLQKKGQE